jgi:hypothetical protein
MADLAGGTKVDNEVLVLRHKIANSIVVPVGLERLGSLLNLRAPGGPIDDGTFVTKWRLTRQFRGTDVGDRCKIKGIGEKGRVLKKSERGARPPFAKTANW